MGARDPLDANTETRSQTYRGLVLALVLGATLRLFHGAEVSLHLDDFHSLFHARNLGEGNFWAQLLRDNHPPLSFLALGCMRLLGGEELLVLRLPNLLYALATIVLTWRLAEPFGRPIRDLAAIGVALSSLHIEITTDLRMYGLLALASVGYLTALSRGFERGAGWIGVTLWVWIGLHTHYHFLHVLFLLGPLSLALCRSRPELRACLRPLVLSYLVAGALALPWYAIGFPQQLAHDLDPGGSQVSWMTLVDGYAHLIFFRVSLAGEPLRSVLVIASGLALCSALAGCLWLSRRRRNMALLLGVPAFLLPAWTALVAYLVPRSGFEWRYLAAAIAPFVLLFTYVALNKRARVLVALVLFAAGLNAVFILRAPGREDYAGAVEYILRERSRSGTDSAVLAADWQPRLFPHGVGWNFYAARGVPAGEALGPQLEHTDDFALTDPAALARFEKVFCILRSIPSNMPFLTQLRLEFGPEDALAFGPSVFVMTFSRTP